MVTYTAFRIAFLTIIYYATKHLLYVLYHLKLNKSIIFEILSIIVEDFQKTVRAVLCNTSKSRAAQSMKYGGLCF